ncbi:hypothetical protein ATCC90586_002043 [Pythium insidiosum]|nr:hypothetical protein ATCC90586_002043 [Pythium insidiosum]
MRRRRSSSSSSSSSACATPAAPTLSQLEMELEASGVGVGAAALGAPEPQFSSSHLRPFYAMSEQRVDAARQLCQRRAHQRLQRHLSAAPADGSDQWKLVKEAGDLRVYRLAPRRHKTTTLLAQGVVRASLAEIMDGLYAETTKEARVQHALLSDAFVDAQLLHVDSYRTAQRPFQFSGVSWFAMATPQGYGVCKDRDFLCFKRTGTFTDEHGHDVGYLTLQSLDSAADATRPASLPFVRGSLHLAALFRPLPNGVVSLFLQAEFNARGHLPARLADNLFVDLAVAISRAGRCGQAKSLAHMLQSTSAGAPLPPGGITSRRDRCGVCARTLWRVLTTPEFCRSCWTRTCRRCRVSLPIYCADFHRAHDGDADAPNDDDDAARRRGGAFRRPRRRRLARPCHETFCAKCACSVVPFGIKLQHEKKQSNALFFKAHAKPKSKTTLPAGQSPSPSPRLQPAPVAVAVAAAAIGPRRRRHAPQAQAPSLSPAGNARRPQVLVTLPPPRRPRAPLPPSSSDGRSSISVLSSVESEKHQRYRLSLSKPSRLSVEEKAPASMLEVLESFQLSHAALDDRTITDEDDDDEPHQQQLVQAATPSGDRKVLVKIDLSTSRRRRARASRRPTVSSSGSSAILSSVSVSSSSTSSRRRLSHRRLSSRPPDQPPSDEYYHRVLQRYLLGHPSRRASFGVGSAASASAHDLLFMDVSESSRHDEGAEPLGLGLAMGLSMSREPDEDATREAAVKVSTTASVSSATSSDRVCLKYLSPSPSRRTTAAARPPAAY